MTNRSSRLVLLVPRDEIETLLSSQTRKDVKVVVPSLLDAAAAASLRAEGRDAKPEVPLRGDRWKFQEGLIEVCESAELALPVAPNTAGLLTIAFALPQAPQSMHLHRHHWELYYSERRLRVAYRLPGHDGIVNEELAHGGLAILGPGVAHQVDPGGLMLVVELPAVAGDKTDA